MNNENIQEEKPYQFLAFTGTSTHIVHHADTSKKMHTCMCTHPTHTYICMHCIYMYTCGKYRVQVFSRQYLIIQAAKSVWYSSKLSSCMVFSQIFSSLMYYCFIITEDLIYRFNIQNRIFKYIFILEAQLPSHKLFKLHLGNRSEGNFLNPNII